MPDDDRPAPSSRRPNLRRETLRDLTPPEAADGPEVEGHAGGGRDRPPARQTTIVSPPTPTPRDLLDHHRETGVVIHGEHAGAGRYRVERRIVTEFSVLEGGKVVVHSSRTEHDQPQRLE
jgi:hypothetical protein